MRKAYIGKGDIVQFSIWEIILAVFLTVFIIMPIGIMLVGSILPKEVTSLDKGIIEVILSFSIENYIEIFRQLSVFNTILNSIVVTVVSMFITCLVSFFIADKIIGLNEKYIKVILACLGLLVLFPFALFLGILSPIWESLRFINTNLGVVLFYVVVCMPFCIFVYVKYLAKFPKNILESAMVDGIDGYRLYKLKFSYLKSAKAITMLFCFIVSWNDVLGVRFLNRIEKDFTINQEILRIISLESIDKVHVWAYFSIISAVIILFLILLNNYILQDNV